MDLLDHIIHAAYTLDSLVHDAYDVTFVEFLICSFFFIESTLEASALALAAPELHLAGTFRHTLSSTNIIISISPSYLFFTSPSPSPDQSPPLVCSSFSHTASSENTYTYFQHGVAPSMPNWSPAQS